MLQEELGKAHRLAAAIDLLDELDGVETGILHEVSAAALGVGDLQDRLRQGDQLLEVEGGADRDLLGVGREMLQAAGRVVAELTDPGQLDVDALAVEIAAQAAPVAQQPRLGRRDRLAGQDHVRRDEGRHGRQQRCAPPPRLSFQFTHCAHLERRTLPDRGPDRAPLVIAGSTALPCRSSDLRPTQERRWSGALPALSGPGGPSRP